MRLVLEESRTSALVQAVRNSELDIAFVRPPVTEDGLQSEVVADEPLVVAMPAEHPLADQERVGIDLLIHERFIVVPWHEHPVLYNEVIGACRQGGFRPTIAEEAHPISSAVLLVAAGLGVSMVLAFLAKHLCQENVVYKCFEEPAGQLQLSLTWPSNRVSPAVSSFVDIVRAVAVTFEP